MQLHSTVDTSWCVAHACIVCARVCMRVQRTAHVLRVVGATSRWRDATHAARAVCVGAMQAHSTVDTSWCVAHACIVCARVCMRVQRAAHVLRVVGATSRWRDAAHAARAV
jgi:hypothetical protein